MKLLQKSVIIILQTAMLSALVVSNASAQIWTGSAENMVMLLDNNDASLSPHAIVDPPSPPAYAQDGDSCWFSHIRAVDRRCTARDLASFNQLTDDPPCCGYGIRVKVGTLPNGYINGLLTGEIRTAKSCLIKVITTTCHTLDNGQDVFTTGTIMEFTTMTQ